MQLKTGYPVHKWACENNSVTTEFIYIVYTLALAGVPALTQLDIRTVTSSLDTLQQLISEVQTFGTDNALVLNPSKCEFLQCHRPNLNPRLSWGIKPTKHHAKCLGYWWCWDLSDTTAIEEAIMKARRAFFAFGAMEAFHGKLNPISGRMIFDTCVIPILLYVSKNWILTASLFDRLEAFQGEIGRRILKLSKFHSTLSTLKWPVTR